MDRWLTWASHGYLRTGISLEFPDYFNRDQAAMPPTTRSHEPQMIASPRRIALLIHALNGGGAERLMSQLAGRWAGTYDVHLVTWANVQSDQYPLPPAVQRYGLDLQVPSKGPLSGFWANRNRLLKLRKQLRLIAPDLVLSFSDQMNIVALEAARPLGVPVWIAEHSDPAKQTLSRLWEAWRSRTYPTCTGCVALTPGIAEFMQRWVPADRLRVIPPAIDPPDVRSSAPAVASSGRHFLYVGRLSREKGVDLVLEAWRQVQPQLPAWRLLIAGDGEELASLRRQAQGLAAVEFLGWAHDPWPLYRAADCFVLPSRYEGFPVALLEAMSQGKATIATSCSSAVDGLAKENQAILTVPTESPEALADAMLRITQNDALRRLLGANAQAIAADYAWSKIGPQWDAILMGPDHSLKR